VTDHDACETFVQVLAHPIDAAALDEDPRASHAVWPAKVVTPGGQKRLNSCTWNRMLGNSQRP
jgi:hypothetical protein